MEVTVRTPWKGSIWISEALSDGKSRSDLTRGKEEGGSYRKEGERERVSFFLKFYFIFLITF